MKQKLCSSRSETQNVREREEREERRERFEERKGDVFLGVRREREMGLEECCLETVYASAKHSSFLFRRLVWFRFQR